jgi:AcrR family transcriptional regulator
VTPAHEQEVRERILVAAAQVFADRGYHRATMQDVVRESGLSVGAIYTYFAGKSELFLAMCDLTSGRAMGELATRLATGRTIAERLAIAVGFYVDSIDDHAGTPGLAALVPAWSEVDSEPAVREMLRRRREQLVTAGRLLVEEGIANGDVPAWVDAEVLAGAYSALLDGLLLQRVEEGTAWRRTTAEERARIVLELLLAAPAGDRPTVPEVAARRWDLTARSPVARR